MVLVIVYCFLIIVELDCIIVLEVGCIVEQGSYVWLLVFGGIYVCYWNCQLGGFLGIDDDDMIEVVE